MVPRHRGDLRAAARRAAAAVARRLAGGAAAGTARACPLGLVGRRSEEVFAKRRERGAKGQINSLRYCAPAVEAAWAELRELQGPARREPPAETPVSERLAALAAALPAGLAEREEWARPPAGAARRRAEAVEASLRRLDEELLASVEGGLAADDSRAARREVEAILAGLARPLSRPRSCEALRGQLRAAAPAPASAGCRC